MEPDDILLLSASSGLINDAKLALKKGANPNALNLGNMSAIQLAAHADCGPIIVMLSEANADLEYPTADGKTPLQNAIEKENSHAIVALVDGGADTSVLWEDGSSVLHHLAKGCMEYVLVQMLKLGVNVNAEDDRGVTPIQIAAESGNTNTVRLLLYAGANFEHLGNVAMEEEVRTLIQGWKANKIIETI